eukprot:PITA_28557
MKDGDSVREHLNAFNTVVSQLLSVDIKISDEDKCIRLLCSLPDSWNSLVIAIGSNATALQFDEIVSALLTEEMRRKNMDNQNGDALSVRGRSQNRKQNKSSSGRSKSRGRSKSPGKPTKVVCWKCGKEGHFRRECKSKAPDKGKGSDDAPSAEVKTTSDEGVKTVFEKDTCKMVRGALVLMRGVRIETLYKLQGSTVVDGCNSSMVPENGAENLVVSGEKTMLWHQRLGHIGEKGLRILHESGEFPSGGKRTKQILELVHSDVFGPMKVPSLDREEDKGAEDRYGGEFYSKEFEEFYKKCGIARQKTTPYTPQQNGVAERMNKTLIERERSMLSGAGLGQEF